MQILAPHSIPGHRKEEKSLCRFPDFQIFSMKYLGRENNNIVLIHCVSLLSTSPFRFFFLLAWDPAKDFQLFDSFHSQKEKERKEKRKRN